MTLRVAIIADLISEQWPSMDLVADQLAGALPRVASDISATLLRPTFPSRLARRIARYKARYRDYPAWLATRRDSFDIFHIVDHSYAHIVHSLPSERTVVTCHDIDAFRCLPPFREPASLLYRRIAPRILAGLRRAVHVTCDSEVTRSELTGAQFVEASRTSVVSNGVHPAFLERPDDRAIADANRLLGSTGRTELLHVGSTIPRKEIEFLLQLFATLYQHDPGVHLIQAGGELTRPQRALADRLEIAHALTVVPAVTAPVLAAIYRRASAVLLPSSREGFGLPVIEAMASDTPVIATDLPVLREVGGDAALYAPANDISQWAAAVQEVVADRQRGAPGLTDRIHRGRVRADRFSWTRCAEQMAAVYRQALETAAKRAAAPVSK